MTPRAAGAADQNMGKGLAIYALSPRCRGPSIQDLTGSIHSQSKATTEMKKLISSREVVGPVGCEWEVCTAAEADYEEADASRAGVRELPLKGINERRQRDPPTCVAARQEALDPARATRESQPGGAHDVFGRRVGKVRYSTPPEPSESSA